MGELEIRGPWVAAAYHGGTGADKFTEDGWFRTGDVVRINQRGCMRISTGPRISSSPGANGSPRSTSRTS